MLGSRAARRLPKSYISFECAPYLLGELRGGPKGQPVVEFRVSPRNLLGSVSLRGGGPGRVGVDERVESASWMPPRLILLDVNQVNYVASPVHPLVEPHGEVSRLDGFDQAPGEVDG